MLRIALWLLPTLLVAQPLWADTIPVRVLDAEAAPVASAVVVVLGGPRGQGTITLDQIQRRFVPALLIGVQGQRLRLLNSDDALHNVHCDSLALRFNVALRAGESHALALERPGSVLLLCNIHAEMRARLLVLESMLYAVTDGRGRAQLHEVPEGLEALRVWVDLDGYRRGHRGRIVGGRAELKIPLKRLRRASPRAAPEREAGPAWRLVEELTGELRAALAEQSAARLRAARERLFLGAGLRAAIRRQAGRKVAFAVEERLRMLEAEAERGALSHGELERQLSELARYLQRLFPSKKKAGS